VPQRITTRFANGQWFCPQEAKLFKFGASVAHREALWWIVGRGSENYQRAGGIKAEDPVAGYLGASAPAVGQHLGGTTPALRPSWP